MFAHVKRNAVALLMGVALGAGLSPVTAQEVITYGSLPDPGYDAVVWAIENGKVSEPGVSLKVERVSSIPALMQAARLKRAKASLMRHNLRCRAIASSQRAALQRL